MICFIVFIFICYCLHFIPCKSLDDSALENISIKTNDLARPPH